MATTTALHSTPRDSLAPMLDNLINRGFTFVWRFGVRQNFHRALIFCGCLFLGIERAKHDFLVVSRYSRLPLTTRRWTYAAQSPDVCQKCGPQARLLNARYRLKIRQ